MNTSPLLSISIPTYNRARCLERLLAILHEQLANDPRVEVIVSDNSSTDGTKEIAEGFLSRGMLFRYIRNDVNVGGDDNIRRCYAMARGRYTWVFGDDDVVAPGALSRILQILENTDYDLFFLVPYFFRGESADFLPHRRLKPDLFKVTDSPMRFADLVDTQFDFMFITSVIINRRRADTLVKPDLSGYVTDNLIQFGWIMPVLKNLRKGMYIDAQLVGQATHNAAGGFDASHYYGRRFVNALNSWLEPSSRLRKKLINNHLTMWAFIWLEWRWDNVSRDKIEVEKAHEKLLPVYGRNFRYWLCIYPLIILPEFLAKAWAFPWLARRKLLRIWYQAITPSVIRKPEKQVSGREAQNVPSP